ncbi:hypothetical protein KIW84_043644 [Lathyrus oleraceus]|uniref:Uncharacterized protein n=1 Tax=Pisum sativum TaxID=3888 RepID=A0A9D5AUB6_PEA|nr:hypothetical protein KIW84_043644 [Pisum sativum]
MDVVREEQAAFKEEMDSIKSKIEQIFEAIQALARREEEARVAAAARNDALVQGVALQSGPSVPIPNPVIYSLLPGFVPPTEITHVPPPVHTSGVADGVAAQGPTIVNQVVIPRTNEELQDEFEMQNYNGATLVVIPTAAKDSEAILITKAVPWNYEPVFYVGNEPVILKEPNVTNIAGVSGVTRSGRVFSPEVIPNKESAPTIEPTKGKEANPPEEGEGSFKKAVTAEEDRELLKIIKKSDYKVID